MMLGMLLSASCTTPHLSPVPDPNSLSSAVSVVARSVLEHFASPDSKQSLSPDDFGIAVAQLDRKNHSSAVADWHGSTAMYPASVVKLFYAVFAANELRAGKRQLTKEYERAIHDMLVDSSNDATGCVLDTITGTTGGPELGREDLARWMKRRQLVNEYFKLHGYAGINACQKTWNEGPYGREHQGYGDNNRLRNSLTANACVKLMSEIALGTILPSEPLRGKDWNAWICSFLQRPIVADGVPVTDFQSKGFSGGVLPAGSVLHSKAGYTDEVKHDVAWVKLPDGREYVWAIFTRHHSDREDMVPFAAKTLLQELGATQEKAP